MSDKEFKSCFFQWRIPKNLRENIMKEMQRMGLLKVEKKKVELLDFYWEERKNKSDFKDGDTKIESPYLSFNQL